MFSHRFRLWTSRVCTNISAGGAPLLPLAGRDLKTVAGRVAGRSIRVATTHLESPIGWEQPFREARQAQLRMAAGVLDRAKEGDVLLAGDMVGAPLLHAERWGRIARDDARQGTRPTSAGPKLPACHAVMGAARAHREEVRDLTREELLAGTRPGHRLGPMTTASTHPARALPPSAPSHCPRPPL